MDFKELEEKMMTDLLDHRDIYKRRAAKIFDIPYEEVTDAQRRIAKVIGFGVLYGMSNYRLQQVIESQQIPEIKMPELKWYKKVKMSKLLNFYSVNYYYLATGMEGRADEKWYGYYEATSEEQAIRKVINEQVTKLKAKQPFDAFEDNNKNAEMNLKINQKYKDEQDWLRSCLSATQISIAEMKRGLK
jgi:hypothetical protein